MAFSTNFLKRLLVIAAALRELSRFFLPLGVLGTEESSTRRVLLEPSSAKRTRLALTGLLEVRESSSVRRCLREGLGLARRDVASIWGAGGARGTIGNRGGVPGLRSGGESRIGG